ncbi:hypothetical protein FB45DRAFT_902088 [Roridomyces roridus]|uniref:Uncharacterized protein n=1 Tax=Roridomyces roridus TaxID=1738132 RepID=A0AAD7FX18_9AGAR|nr:hypothetical protein FB45DRAFT_902088 [Roridomyces roridus]
MLCAWNSVSHPANRCIAFDSCIVSPGSRQPRLASSLHMFLHPRSLAGRCHPRPCITPLPANLLCQRSGYPSTRVRHVGSEPAAQRGRAPKEGTTVLILRFSDHADSFSHRNLSEDRDDDTNVTWNCSSSRRSIIRTSIALPTAALIWNGVNDTRVLLPTIRPSPCPPPPPNCIPTAVHRTADQPCHHVYPTSSTYPTTQSKRKWSSYRPDSPNMIPPRYEPPHVRTLAPTPGDGASSD